MKCFKKLVDEKEKIGLLDERERQEHEEKFRKKLRELQAREQEVDKKVREFSARERDLDKREKELDQLEHIKLSSNIDKIAPHNIYTNKIQTMKIPRRLFNILSVIIHKEFCKFALKDLIKPTSDTRCTGLTHSFLWHR